MKKGKFFCKLLGMAFATFTAFSGLLVNNCTYAFPTKTIIENLLKNELCKNKRRKDKPDAEEEYKFSDEEYEFVNENLGIKSYDELLKRISEDCYANLFVREHSKTEEELDSAYFLLFLRLISYTCEELREGALSRKLIIKIIHCRSIAENRSDKYLAKCFDNFFGTNFKILLTCCSSRTLRNLRS